jgi:hypothetical protein
MSHTDTEHLDLGRIKLVAVLTQLLSHMPVPPPLVPAVKLHVHRVYSMYSRTHSTAHRSTNMRLLCPLLRSYVCGTCSSSSSLTHESMSTHEPDGRLLCIHSVAVQQQHRRQGIASRWEVACWFAWSDQCNPTPKINGWAQINVVFLHCTLCE